MTPTADIVGADKDVHEFPLIHKVNLEKVMRFVLSLWRYETRQIKNGSNFLSIRRY